MTTCFIEAAPRAGAAMLASLALAAAGVMAPSAAGQCASCSAGSDSSLEIIGGFVQECNLEDCWDLNGNGACDLADEDIDGDGDCDIADCAWTGFAFPIRTDGGQIDTVTVHLASNLAGGDLYIMAEANDPNFPCQPDVTNILASRCCAVDPLATGAPVEIHFPAVDTSADTPTWVVFVERTGSAGQDDDGNFDGSDGGSFAIARDTTSGDEPGRAYANLVDTGNPGDWSDLFDPDPDSGFGQCYVVGLSFTGQEPDIVDCADHEGACCLVEGSCVEATHDFLCFVGEGSSYAGDGVDCAGANCEPLCSFSGPDGPCGDPDAGACGEANDSPGCDDPVCCCEVCEGDPFCCLDPKFGGGWDEDCAILAIDLLCASVPIDQLGACCLTTSCFLATAEDCAVQAGEYQGDGVDCGAGNPLIFESSPEIDLPDNDPVGVSDAINVPDSFSIGDLEVQLTITHTWIGDLCVSLEHNGVVVNLIQRPGGDEKGDPCHLGFPFGCLENNYVGIVLDDVAVNDPIEDACATDLTSPPNYLPNEALSAFNGMGSSGDWTITVSDNAGADLGTFNSWSLAIKAEGCPSQPEACPWDLDGPQGVPDGDVGVPDLLVLLGAWAGCDKPCPPTCPADFDGPQGVPDCDVGVPDLLTLLGFWGPCP